MRFKHESLWSFDKLFSNQVWKTRYEKLKQAK